MSDKVRSVIIDCDPGVDDAYAIAVALQAKELNVLAIHTTAGNVGIDHTTRNARGLVYRLGKQVPVCQGAAKFLCAKPVAAAEIHGNNGLAGYEFDQNELVPLSEKSALQSYYELLSKAEEPVDIIATGPLTNVAILLMSYPQLKDKISTVSIMGGGLRNGNITPMAEFNFYADPEAAQLVFQSGIDLIMAGLDVTERARLYEEDIEKIGTEGGSIGPVLREIAQGALMRHKAKLGIASTQPNDVCAVFALIEPQLFSGERLHVEIETSGRLTRGMTVADRRLMNRITGNHLVLLDVDEDAFRKTLVKRLTRGQE